MIHKGSCLCGKVQYEIHGEIKNVLNCHCPMCRKAHGAAFRTRGAVSPKDFKWISGKDQVQYYNSSPGQNRSFCKTCGSTLITKYEDPDHDYGFPLGTLDTDPGVKAHFHIYVEAKAPWYEIADDLPQYDTLPDDLL
jgi:hypothetical protein